LYRQILIWSFLLFGVSIYAQIAIYGDTRTQHDIHRQVVAQLTQHSFHTLFHSGDLVQQGLRQSEYDNFLEIIDPLTQNAAFYPARGNHEKNKDLFLDNFLYLSDTYYAVSIDSIRWIILDSTRRLSPGSAQYTWLQQQLTDSDLPIIIIVHHPVFSSGKHGDELGLGLFLPALFGQYPVKAVFSGHDHCYERSFHKGIHYITTGGGGAPLYDHSSRNDHSQVFHKAYHYCILDPVDRNQIRVKVYGLHDRIIDEFTISLR